MIYYSPSKGVTKKSEIPEKESPNLVSTSIKFTKGDKEEIIIISNLELVTSGGLHPSKKSVCKISGTFITFSFS